METIKELRKICQPPEGKSWSPSGWGYQRHRYLSIYITRVVLRLAGNKIKPNYVSLFNILFGIIVLILIAINQSQLFFVLLLFLFYFSFLLDKVDGEIARYQKHITLQGAYLDEIYHLFVQNGFILALGINRFMASGKNLFLFVGAVGFFLFTLSRYIRKIRYFIYAKYKAGKHEFKINRELSRLEKLLVRFLNIFALKLCSIARRRDIFLFLVLILAIFCFNWTGLWFLFLFLWLLALILYVLRFLFLNYLFIDRDVQLVDENKL